MAKALKSGVLPDEIKLGHRLRSRRVVLLLIVLVLLGLGDLYLTITHARTLGMNEVNPIGAYLIAANSAAGLILWKLGTMGLTTGALMKVRHHKLAEAAAWLLVAVMTGLTLHWSNYNHQLAQALTKTGYNEVSAQMQNQLVDGAE